jgi:hypothetical protein
MQNSFVTQISNAVIENNASNRTFTDLGIDISQLFFDTFSQEKLKDNIKLQFTIITFFFLQVD